MQKSEKETEDIMKNIKLFSAFILMVVILFSFGCGGDENSTDKKSSAAQYQVNLKMPEFRVHTVDGKEILLDKNFYNGVPVIFDIWATWCPPCVKEIPHFIELKKMYGDKIKIVGISADKGSDIVKEFMSKTDINYNIFMGNQQIMQYFKVTGIPTTIIINKDMVMVDKVVGYHNLDFFKYKLDSLISE